MDSPVPGWTSPPGPQAEDDRPRRTAEWRGWLGRDAGHTLSIILALAVLGVFSSVPSLGWVDFDDTANVTENPRFFPLTWRNWLSFWQTPYENLYIPVAYSAYGIEACLDRWLAGRGPAAPLRPWLFHTVSLLLHVVAVGLVYRILRTCRFDALSAFTGSLLFGLHPLQVETVAWVSEQRGLLSAVFSLTAVHLLLDERTGSWEAGWSIRTCLATFVFGMALLSKPSAVVVPVVAWVLGSTQGGSFRTLGLVLWPWFLMAAIVVGVTRFVQPHGLPPEWLSPGARFLVGGDALAFYVRKLFCPVGLTAAYGRTPGWVLETNGTFPLACAAYAGLAAPWLIRGLRGLRLPVILFVAALLPVLGFAPFVFQNQSTVGDRYAYLAMVGPAWCIASLWNAQRCRSMACGTCVVALFLLLGVMSRFQVEVWRNTASLAGHAVALNPKSEAGWAMLSGYESTYGTPDRAVACADRALSINPANLVAMVNLFEGLALTGGSQAAAPVLGQLERSGHSQQFLADVFSSRACVHLAEGRDDRAAALCRLSLSLDGTSQAAMINLCVALSRLGRQAEAAQLLREFTLTHPTRIEGWVGLGNALLALGNPAEAKECYTRALKLDPSDTDVLMNRALAHEQLGDLSAAKEDRAAAARIVRHGPET